MGVVVLGLGVIVGGLAWHFRPTHNVVVSNSNPALQQVLQANLSTAVGTNQNQTVVDLTTQLINGEKSGKFKLTNSTLAQYYLDKASALYNLQQYAQAVDAYEVAPELDGNTKEAALQGDVSARYALGQRQQLIPLLQQLVQLAKHNDDTRGGTPEQYQEDITALQHNQAVNL